MSLREGWETEARSWARFVQTPRYDHFHEHINFPTLLELLPPPRRRTLDLACGEGRVGRHLLGLRYRVMAIDSTASTPPTSRI